MKISLCLTTLVGLILGTGTHLRADIFGVQAKHTARQLYYKGQLVSKTPRFRKPVVKRTIVQVDNNSLSGVNRATRKGYLEVIIPANKGHVLFRHGDGVFDFSEKGLRKRGPGPIKSQRYGVLVKLTAGQERCVTEYFNRLERTGGAELGTYDFMGREGFHCVTWFTRLRLDGKKNLVQLLGGNKQDEASMPNFARFMIRQARGVDALVLYDNQPLTQKQLGRFKFKLVTNEGIVAQHDAL